MTEIPSYKSVMEQLSKIDYAEYVEYAHQMQDLDGNINNRYIHGKFTRYISQTVQEFVEKDTGNAYDILCLSVPPQHSKSTTITETLPSWILGMNPDARIFLIAYNLDLAKRFLRRNRDKVELYGKDVFGVEVGDINNAEEMTIKDHQGSIKSAGITGGITGYPADFFIIDDPIKNRQEAESEATRNMIFQEWFGSIKSRLGVGAKVIIIQTRWHKEDLIGRIVETEPTAIYINFPIECEDETDELGRFKGETLFPEIKKDRKWWDSFKQSYLTKEGSRSLNSLYYGRPSNDEGGIFERKWFTDNMYQGTVKVNYTVIEVDATFKDTSKSDFVAIQVWGKRNQDYYLIEKVKRRMGFIDTVRAITEIANKYSNYNELGVEDKANGSAIIDVLKRKFRAVVPIVPYGSKEARASAVSPLIEAGNVHLKEEHYSVIDEAVDFPNSDHDDEVDAMTQALDRLRNVVANDRFIKDPDILDYDDEVENILGYGV